MHCSVIIALGAAAGLASAVSAQPAPVLTAPPGSVPEARPTRPSTPEHFPFSLPPGAMPVPGAPGAYLHPDVPTGFVIIDGDIQVPLADYLLYLAGSDAVFGDASFWPSGLVPYDFASNVNATNRQRAIDAMNAISARTGVSFFPATSEPYRIRFNDSTGNNSPVGWGLGVRTINIVSWTSQFTIVHELYHSLGFWHQQSASNRNSYVTINWQNICTTCCSGGDCAHNFEIRSGASLYGDYDFESFMHYPRGAFASGPGLDTITVNPPWNSQWQNAIGQRDHFSYWDELVCRGIYRYSSDYWWQSGASGSGNLPSPIGGSLASRISTLPAGSTLFIKQNANYAAVGTYSNPITIRAPLGATLGN